MKSEEKSQLMMQAAGGRGESCGPGTRRFACRPRRPATVRVAPGQGRRESDVKSYQKGSAQTWHSPPLPP